MIDDQNKAPLQGDEWEGVETSSGDEDWLRIVQEAYHTSTDYFDANYRNQIERNVSNFRNEHPAGSKYHTDAYKSRSRLFRPKLRSSQRKAEAAFASAMFSTTEVFNIEPVNQDSKQDDVLCEIWEAALNHRLKHSVPWFKTAIGAFQKAQVDGVCISRQYWEYSDSVKKSPVVDDMTGFEVEAEERVVEEDRPKIRLIEIENIRFDPAADWIDPLNTSPYIIEILPMYVNDVIAYMNTRDEKTGGYNWTEYSPEELIAANKDLSSNRISKKQGEQNPEDAGNRIKEFELIYVFRNIINKEGKDWEFYTVGTKLLLSDPVELKSPNGRGYVLGVSNIEAHRAMPSSAMELGQGLQAEANDVANLRLDNVKLALHKRRYAQRGKGTDLSALRRYSPGATIITDDINSIREEDTRDVTSSSYAEQDRLNVDIDDIVGGFSISSVASNRALNQTVGGMQMLNNSTNALTEYVVRCFVETWVEPVLDHIVLLMQAYEDEANINRFAEGKQIDGKPLDLSANNLLKEVKVTASVGFGNLDPKMKVQGLLQTIGAIGQLSPTFVQRLDEEAIAREAFSVSGYRNGQKFIKNEQEGAQPADQAQQQAAAQADAQKMQMQMQIEQARLAQEKELTMAKMAQEKEIKIAELQLKYQSSIGQLDLENDKHNLNIISEMGSQEKVKRDREEMMLKEKMGSGI